MAGREGVQHADSDAGWRLGRRDLGLNLDPEIHVVRVRVRVRVRMLSLRDGMPSLILMVAQRRAHILA